VNGQFRFFGTRLYQGMRIELRWPSTNPSQGEGWTFGTANTECLLSSDVCTKMRFRLEEDISILIRQEENPARASSPSMRHGDLTMWNLRRLALTHPHPNRQHPPEADDSKGD